MRRIKLRIYLNSFMLLTLQKLAKIHQGILTTDSPHPLVTLIERFIENWQQRPKQIDFYGVIGPSHNCIKS